MLKCDQHVRGAVCGKVCVTVAAVNGELVGD